MSFACSFVDYGGKCLRPFLRINCLGYDSSSAKMRFHLRKKRKMSIPSRVRVYVQRETDRHSRDMQQQEYVEGKDINFNVRFSGGSVKILTRPKII